jgi:hypothetical protein
MFAFAAKSRLTAPDTESFVRERHQVSTTLEKCSGSDPLTSAAREMESYYHSATFYGAICEFAFMHAMSLLTD